MGIKEVIESMTSNTIKLQKSLTRLLTIYSQSQKFWD
jgi:hypothetical protein